jgi:hypothetical protein
MEKEILQQLVVVNEDLVKERESLRILSEQNYNEIIQALSQELEETKNELDHAKVNLIQYINSLNKLEELIKQNNSYDFTENEEIERLRLENDRLNEENSSLISSKKSMEDFYSSSIAQLK